MKKRVAYVLRRTARRFIAWSNRLDAPSVHIRCEMYATGAAFDKVAASTARVILSEERLAEARRRHVAGLVMATNPGDGQIANP